MVALFDDAALVEDDDFIGVDNGREAVSNDEVGGVFGDVLDGFEDGLFGFAVQ